MKYSEIKRIKSELENISLEDSWKEVIENMTEETEDFEVDNYRFIHEDNIDEIQQKELSGDTYMLGSFYASFIADNTDLSLNIVKALQEANKFNTIGQHILDNDYLETMQEAYSSQDGYGAHFNSYDGNEEEINSYHVFRIN